MTRKPTFSHAGIVVACVALSFGCVIAQENNRPVVKITAPQGRSPLPLNTLIPFAISVSDKEEGESKFGEINGQEVYLTVRYLSDPLQATAALSTAGDPDPPGFVILQKSNCISCHAFNAPLIGPSFAELTRRYPYSKTNETLLAKRILNGSSGIWGSTAMPGHPELTPEAAQLIMAWILQNTGDVKTKYYSGLEGTLRLIIPEGERPGGIFILRASYTDHGLNNQKAMQGTDALLVHGK